MFICVLEGYLNFWLKQNPPVLSHQTGRKPCVLMACKSACKRPLLLLLLLLPLVPVLRSLLAAASPAKFTRRNIYVVSPTVKARHSSTTLTSGCAKHVFGYNQFPHERGFPGRCHRCLLQVRDGAIAPSRRAHISQIVRHPYENEGKTPSTVRYCTRVRRGRNDACCDVGVVPKPTLKPRDSPYVVFWSRLVWVGVVVEASPIPACLGAALNCCIWWKFVTMSQCSLPRSFFGISGRHYCLQTCPGVP